MREPVSVTIDLPYNVIQSIRLIHALLECDIDLRIPRHHHSKFKELTSVFDIELTAGTDDVPVLPETGIEHEGIPRTYVGNIERPLILAHQMVEHCRSLWKEQRDVTVSFAGRLHYERRITLEEWLSRARPQMACEMPDQQAVDERVEFRKKVHRLGEEVFRGPLRPLQNLIYVPPIESRVENEDVVLMTSDRGWSFPTKAWDAEYFDLLSNSKFVLCPDGKFVWTYRFFEAILCGAVPVVEADCELYDGFRFFTMDQSPDTLDRRREDVLHNFRRCRHLLTVPRDELEAEIERLVA